MRHGVWTALSPGRESAPAPEEGRSSRGYSFPAATFLTEVPAVPSAVRVDCGAVTAIQHMHPDYLAPRGSRLGTPA